MTSSKQPTLAELLAQRAELDRQIAQVQREQRAEAIARVKALMTEHGVTMADIGGHRAVAPQAASPNRVKVAAKYRDPATGATWSGRGLKPKWLAQALAAGRSLADFAV